MSNDESLLTGSTRRLLREFKTLNIECEVANGELNLVRYKTAHGTWRFIKGMVSEKLPHFSYMTCENKWWTYNLFMEMKMPTPKTALYTTDDSAVKFMESEKNIVVKPQSGAHGYGVTLNVSTEDELHKAVAHASSVQKNLILQQQVDGRDIRILVINGTIISALERLPAVVIGDATHTVRELIDLENTRPERGVAGVDALIQISVPATEQYLSTEQLDSIPDFGKRVRVTGPSNHSLGGTVHDVMQELTSEMKKQITDVTKRLNMPIAGVDCIIDGDRYYFLEINASPGIGIHDDDFAGVTSGCFNAYAKLLFADNF